MFFGLVLFVCFGLVFGFALGFFFWGGVVLLLLLLFIRFGLEFGVYWLVWFFFFF